MERQDAEGPNYFLDSPSRNSRGWRSDIVRTFIAKTTVDLDLQRAAEDAIESNLRQYGEQYKASEGAMVVIDHDGAVRAIVGGRDYGLSQFNRAYSSRRQPGSSFKPFVYASAIENFGYDENTKITDGPVCVTRPTTGARRIMPAAMLAAQISRPRW
ncbi:MAG: penicillin-binding transpeptidase domain-containing protein [Nitratireductor sp.]